MHKEKLGWITPISGEATLAVPKSSARTASNHGAGTAGAHGGTLSSDRVNRLFLSRRPAVKLLSLDFLFELVLASKQW